MSNTVPNQRDTTSLVRALGPVDATMIEPAPQAPVVPEAPPKKDRALDKALAEPAVKSFAGKFNARVVAHEPAKGKAEPEEE